MTIDVAVVGAHGIVGRRICDALTGLTIARVGRGDPMEMIGEARVIVDAAGPLRETAEPVLAAAIANGAHYIDVGGEQTVLRRLYEGHDANARRAGLVALPGCGMDCVIGDLAAAWAAAHLCGIVDDGPVVRERPGMRIAEDKPLDEIAISYVFEDFALSAGSQAALFGRVGEPPLAWVRDRWEATGAGKRRRVNAGPAFGGERECVAHAGGEPLSVPRHVIAKSIATYASTTRSVVAARAVSWLARALPLMPRAAQSVLSTFATPEDELAKTRFAIIAQVRRGFAAAQVAVRGRDPSRTTASIAAWFAAALYARDAGPTGMRAPAELVRPELALRELATVADLTIEPSFG
jgi:hypothetical protein